MLKHLCSREHWSVIDALHAISQWPEGVAALADLDVFEELQQVAKKETHADDTQKLHTILDNIAQYKADSVPEGVDS
jgi:ribosomal protein L10